MYVTFDLIISAPIEIWEIEYSGNWNLGNWSSGNWSLGNWSSGNWGSENWNSGNRIWNFDRIPQLVINTVPN